MVTVTSGVVPLSTVNGALVARFGFVVQVALTRNMPGSRVNVQVALWLPLPDGAYITSLP